MLLTDKQMGLATLLVAETQPIKPIDVNTITLASMLRRGMLKATQRSVQLTPLGEHAYKWNLQKHFRSWKDDLAQARRLKHGRKQVQNG